MLRLLSLLPLKEKGEVFGIIGYSGAGKKYIDSMCKFIRKTNDRKYHCKRTRLNNVIDKRTSKIETKIGMIFQGFNLLKTVTVYENIALPLRLAGIQKQKLKKE